MQHSKQNSRADMLLLNKKLWCCPLNIGVIIIANISIVLSLLAVWALNQDDNHGGFITINGVKSSTMEFIQLMGALTLIIVNFLLLIGVMKRQQKLIILWLIVVAIYIILISTTFLITTFTPASELIDLDEPVGLCFLLGLVTFSGFWYWVYNYNEVLKKQNDPTSYNELSSNTL